MRIASVGAGVAGLACAERLAQQGHDLTVLDKGRGPGGRMSTHRIMTAAGEATFDLSGTLLADSIAGSDPAGGGAP